ncbi:hypothetical protein Tco_0286976 [Tanacetum coccineum]
MNSTKASSSNPFKKIKLTIIPPRQLFVNISSDEDITTTPFPTTTFSSLTPPNAPSKTPSTNQTSSSQENTSSSYQSKLQISPPSSSEPTSPQPLNPLLDNILDVPPRPSNPQPLQSHPYLDITLSLSPITPLDHIHNTLHPPSPTNSTPIMGHPPLLPTHSDTTMKEQALSSKPSVITPTRLPYTASGSKPKPWNSYQQPRNWPPSMNSRVSNKVVNTAEPPRNSKPFLNSKNLVCPTCKKCIYTANHDACILQYLSKVNSHASAQKTCAQSFKITERYILVENKSDAKKRERRIFSGHRFSPNKSSAVYVKTTPPRFGLTWKPTGRIFTYVGLRWIPTGKTAGTCLNINDSIIPLGKKTCTPNTVICANSFSLSASTTTTPGPISSMCSTNDTRLLSKYQLMTRSSNKRKCALVYIYPNKEKITTSQA